MFVLDDTLAAIEADEADVLEMHRSVEPVALSPDNRAPRPCDALVCSIRRSGGVRLYVVVQPTDRKGCFIYVSDSLADEGAATGALTRDALNFASSFGFSMQQVNLSYSKAMREVVIRDGKLIRRPAGPVAKDTLIPAVQEVGGPSPVSEAPAVSVAPVPIVPEAVPAAPPPLTETQLAAEAEQLAAAKAAEEEAQAERLAALRSDIDRLSQEKVRREEEYRREEAQLAAERERLAAEVRGAEQQHVDRLAPLRADVERLQADRETLDRTQEHEVEVLKGEMERLTAEACQASGAAEGLIAALKTELEQLLAKRADAERASTERISWLKEEIKLVAVRRDEAETAASAEIQTLEDELEQLTAALARDDLRLTARLAELRVEHDRLAAERDTFRRQASEQLAQLYAETDLLAAEKNAVAALVAGRGGAGVAELLARSEAEIAALKAEVARLAAANVAPRETIAAEAAVARAAERGTPAGAVATVTIPPKGPHTVAAAEPSPEGAAAFDGDRYAAWEAVSGGDAATHMPLAPDAGDPFAFLGGSGPDEGFGAPSVPATAGAGATFHLEPSGTAIAYAAPDEVLELYQSLNEVTIIPHGHPPQQCSAYICVVRGDGGPRVFVAWHLKDDDTFQVHVPERQPADAEECRGVVHAAQAFVETVGFMMDKVRLAGDPDKRSRALAKVPVFTCTR